MRTQNKSPQGGSVPKQGPAEKIHPKDLCKNGCGKITFERNRFYRGKFVTELDLTIEQGYFLHRLRAHNRLLHGWGILCGLHVQPHRTPGCDDRYVTVTPGIAIDCCGRELVLEKPQVVEIWDPSTQAVEGAPGGMEAADAYTEEEFQKVDEARQGGDLMYSTVAGKEAAQAGQGEPAQPPQPPAGPGEYLLVIQYHEEGVEWMPVLYSEDACDTQRLEANRVREIARLVVIQRGAFDEQCWPVKESEKNGEIPPCRQDCDSPETGHIDCVEPHCACAQGVPLALITPVPADKRPGYVIGETEIHKEGRKDLNTPPEHLTHIVDYNWTHGGVVTLSELLDPNGMNKELRIYFDRRIMEPDPDDYGTGVNIHTFQVQEHDTNDLRYTPCLLYNDDVDLQPYLDFSDTNCSAVFPINEDLLLRDENLGGKFLHVILRCDFILDCFGRPVDGDHRGGHRRTGDGSPGGTFESWFRVVDDMAESRKQKQAADAGRRQQDQPRRPIRGRTAG